MVKYFYTLFRGSSNYFKQALVDLDQAIWRSSAGDDSSQKIVESFGGTWMFTGAESEIVANEIVHGGDADLIALMYNVLAEQVTLLKASSAITNVDDPVFQLTLALATKIVK